MTVTMRTDGPEVAPFVVDRTAECRAANPNNTAILLRLAISHLVVHRTDLDTLDPEANPDPVPNDQLDGPALALRFANPRLGTAGRIPYHFLLRADEPTWTLEQMLPLSARGAHAIGYNWRAIGVAAVGDFRRYPPQPGAYDKLVRLCGLLIPINGGLLTVGHTDLPGAAADTTKVCPGSYLPVKPLAAQALASLPEGWMGWTEGAVTARLTLAGIVV